MGFKEDIERSMRDVQGYLNIISDLTPEQQRIAYFGLLSKRRQLEDELTDMTLRIDGLEKLPVIAEYRVTVDRLSHALLADIAEKGSRREFEIMTEIEQSELAAASGSVLLGCERRLHDAKFVEFAPDPSASECRIISITDAGREYLQRVPYTPNEKASAVSR